MWKLWRCRAAIKLHTRMRLYNACALPVLTYNSGTWGATEANFERLAVHHRWQLSAILGIRWPQRMSNKDLYKITGSRNTPAG